jgi:uncharacterized OB-fold protein
MDVLEPGAEGAPPIEGRELPEMDTTAAPFWQAAAEGKLLIQECPGCGHRQFYPRALCTACGGDTAWLETAGRGRIYTFTIVRANHAQPFKGLLPYVVGMVELDEGPRMMANFSDIGPDDVHIGQEVECFAVKVEEGLAIPFWRSLATRG